MNRPCPIRGLKITWTALCGVTAVLLICLWVRSINYMNRLTWHYRLPNAVQVGTVPGQVIIFTFVDTPIVPYSQKDPSYKVWTRPFENIRLINGKMRWWFDASSHPTGVSFAIPDWFLIALSAALAAIPWIRWSKRFTVRSLLIAVTVISLLLGLLMYFSR